MEGPFDEAFFMQGAETFMSFMNFTKTVHKDLPASLSHPPGTLPSPFVAVVIGASRGIGARTAACFARAGASSVYLTARNPSSAEGAAAECRRLNPEAKVSVVQADLTDEASIQALADQVWREAGRVDVVIPNGGIVSSQLGQDMLQMSVEGFRTTFDTNCVGEQMFAAARSFVPLLRDTPLPSPRAFIGITSVASGAMVRWYGHVDYCISKLGATRLCQMVDFQYGPKGAFRTDAEGDKGGIFAVSLHPGAVWTDMPKQTAGEPVTEREKACAAFFESLLKDSPDLCGAFCVWLTKRNDRAAWLGGRQLSVAWDVDELEARRQEIVEKELLKFDMKL